MNNFNIEKTFWLRFPLSHLSSKRKYKESSLNHDLTQNIQSKATNYTPNKEIIHIKTDYNKAQNGIRSTHGPWELSSGHDLTNYTSDEERARLTAIFISYEDVTSYVKGHFGTSNLVIACKMDVSISIVIGTFYEDIVSHGMYCYSGPNHSERLKSETLLKMVEW